MIRALISIVMSCMIFMPEGGLAQQTPIPNAYYKTLAESPKRLHLPQGAVRYDDEFSRKVRADNRAYQEKWKREHPNGETTHHSGRPAGIPADYSDPFSGWAVMVAVVGILVLSTVFLCIYRFVLRRREKLFEVWLIGVLLFSTALGLQRVILYLQTSALEGLVFPVGLVVGWPLIFFVPQALLFRWISLRRPFVLSALMSFIWMLPMIGFFAFLFLENALRG